MRKIYHILLILCGILSGIITSSCTEERFVSLDEQIQRTYKIAVVLPFSNGMDSIWRKSVNWALENLNASLVPHRHICIQAEWHDEDSENPETLFRSLANRTDIHAIIGPLYSADASLAARYSAQTGKTLIPAMATSALLMRAYAGKGFLWCLAENDISQCEVLLARAMQKGASSVSLLAPDNGYGRTFSDWFGFQAQELGLKVHSVTTYSNQDLETNLSHLLQEETDCLICVPTDNEVTQRMNTTWRNTADVKPFLLFSDAAFLTLPNTEYEGMEGIALTHNPQSGFHINYEARYGNKPEFGTAHFYDAVLLTGLACLMADLEGNKDINQAMTRLVNFDGTEINGSSREGTDCIIKALLSGHTPHVTGASGKLQFDARLHTNVLHSVYCHWMVYQGKHLILEYNTSDDDMQSAGSVINWKRRGLPMQTFGQEDKIYAPCKDLHALVIAGSSGWENYRHQANAYALYQLLKANGLTDEQITLVAEDDLAYHQANPNPGVIKLTEDGTNLYPGRGIDFRPSTTSWQSFCEKIADGVFLSQSDSGSNLIVYWAGHGIPKGLKWAEETISSEEIAHLFRELAAQKRFRKALLLLETCYSGKTGKQCEGIPGLLCITAANAIETSKADCYSALLSTWLSNSFTDALLKNLAQHPDNSMYELYAALYKQTIGSHVSVYNAVNFANLYRNKVSEFLYPVSSRKQSINNPYGI